MQHDRRQRGAAHSGVRYANHVLDASVCEFAGDRQIARLRHSGGAAWPGVLQHQNVVGLHVKVWIVEAVGKIFQRREHHGPAFMFREFGCRCCALQNRATGRQRTAHRDQPAIGTDRIVRGTDDFAVDRIGQGPSETLRERPSGDVAAFGRQRG